MEDKIVYTDELHAEILSKYIIERGRNASYKQCPVREYAIRQGYNNEEELFSNDQCWICETFIQRHLRVEGEYSQEEGFCPCFNFGTQKAIDLTWRVLHVRFPEIVLRHYGV